MDPCGGFVHGSLAAVKHCPKDSRDLMDFMDLTDFMDSLKSLNLKLINGNIKNRG